MTTALSPAPARDPLLGATIDDRFEIVGLLGRGRTAAVYEARERRLGRAVALKVLQPHASVDGTAIKRFKRECAALSQLAHPSLVEIHDVGHLPDGRPYFVMPRLRGRDLATLAREAGPLPVERVLDLLAGPAAALDLAHHAGFVHRDLKPANLFVETLATGQEHVRVIDFGLARLGESQGKLTREGHVVGTARYLSPEAARGEPIDRRADVYSLACTIFELLTGAPPFLGGSKDVLLEKLRKDAPTLAERGLDAPPALEAALARGLSRDPTARPASAGALLAELGRAIGRAMPAPAPTLEAVLEPSVVVSPELGRSRARAPQPPTEIVPRVERREPPASSASIELPMTRFPWPAAAIVAAVVLAGGLALLFGASQSRAGAADPGAAPPPPAPPPAAVRPPAPPTPAPAPAPEPSAAPAPVPAPRAIPAPLAPRSARSGAAPSEVPADPARAAELARRGTAALLEGLVPEAVARFTEATIAAPRHPAAWRGLGLANQRLGRPAEARRAFERYLALAPDAADAAAIRARIEALR